MARYKRPHQPYTGEMRLTVRRISPNERGDFLSDNWIVSNLENALADWNGKLGEISLLN